VDRNETDSGKGSRIIGGHIPSATVKTRKKNHKAKGHKGSKRKKGESQGGFRVLRMKKRNKKTVGVGSEG